MAYEHKPGTGTIFKVEDKKSDNFPDYKGDIVLEDGTKKQIALWVREKNDGGKYFSAKISAPYIAPETTETIQEDDKNDLPF